MGKIFVIMGKTSSGKDTVFKYLLDNPILNQGVREELKTVVSYTTRPMRPGETDGVEYFFVPEERLRELREQGKVLEERCYQTVHGPWYYFTVLDGQIDLENHDYLMINTLVGFEKLRAYYNCYADGMVDEEHSDCPDGAEWEKTERTVIPVYIDADPKERLLRYINRESKQAKPNYSEVCRRFLADEEDFSEEKLEQLGVTKRYLNQNLEECCQEIWQDIGRILYGSKQRMESRNSVVCEKTEQGEILIERGQFHG